MVSKLSCSLRRRSRLTTELQTPSFASGGSLIPRKPPDFESLASKSAAWCGSLEASQSFPSIFITQPALTGEQLPASGSLQRTEDRQLAACRGLLEASREPWLSFSFGKAYPSSLRRSLERASGSFRTLSFSFGSFFRVSFLGA